MLVFLATADGRLFPRELRLTHARPNLNSLIIATTCKRWKQRRTAAPTFSVDREFVLRDRAQGAHAGSALTRSASIHFPSSGSCLASLQLELFYVEAKAGLQQTVQLGLRQGAMARLDFEEASKKCLTLPR